MKNNTGKKESRVIKILIYGDSNTWGSSGSGLRYPSHEQWPAILAKKLGPSFEVIQEGLCGRIAGDHDIDNPHRNGKAGYEIIMRSAAPFDYLVIALGSNDIKNKYSLRVSQILEDLKWYDERTMAYNSSEADMESRFKKTIFLGIANYDINKFESGNHLVAADLKSSMTRFRPNLVELNNLEHSEDGLHYSIGDHEIVASAVYNKLKEVADEI